MKTKHHPWQWHPAEPTGRELPPSARAAEFLVRWLGSGSYLIVQTVVVGLWIAFNLIAVALQFDPYPFILLNLAFSTQAAYAAPLILLAQRRVDERNSERAQHDYEADIETLELVRDIHSRLKGSQ